MPTIKYSNIDTVIGTKGQSAIHAFSRDSQNRLIYERRILGRGDTIKMTDDNNVELYNQYYIRPSDDGFNTRTNKIFVSINIIINIISTMMSMCTIIINY